MRSAKALSLPENQRLEAMMACARAVPAPEMKDGDDGHKS